MLYPHNTTVKETLLRRIAQAHPPKRKTKSLVMLSGGLDSVALLAAMLEHTDHEIHAHHIEIRNYENRAEIENETLARIVPYLTQRYRPFTYSTSKYELMMGTGGGLDMTLALFMAARVTIAEGTFQDFIFTGHVRANEHEHWEAAAVLAAAFTNHRTKPVWLVPLRQLTKFDIYNAIPPELADMTWSCRRPVFDGSHYSKCGECHACKTRVRLAGEIAQFKAKIGAA